MLLVKYWFLDLAFCFGSLDSGCFEGILANSSAEGPEGGRAKGIVIFVLQATGFLSVVLQKDLYLGIYFFSVFINYDLKSSVLSCCCYPSVITICAFPLAFQMKQISRDITSKENQDYQIIFFVFQNSYCS